jgi:hypothetical protein
MTIDYYVRLPSLGRNVLSLGCLQRYGGVRLPHLIPDNIRLRVFMLNGIFVLQLPIWCKSLRRGLSLRGLSKEINILSLKIRISSLFL